MSKVNIPDLAGMSYQAMVFVREADLAAAQQQAQVYLDSAQERADTARRQLWRRHDLAVKAAEAGLALSDLVWTEVVGDQELLLAELDSGLLEAYPSIETWQIPHLILGGEMVIVPAEATAGV